MIRKIKYWLGQRKYRKQLDEAKQHVDQPNLENPVSGTPIEVSEIDYAKDLHEAYNLGYAAGKAEGLRIAKQAAVQQLKQLTRS